jgi:formate dehydrogenase iron-sulfur subunit
MSYAVLVDISLCSGCRACVGACKLANNLPMDQQDWYQASYNRGDYLPSFRHSPRQPRLSASSYTVVEYHDIAPDAEAPRWMFTKRQCMHCLHPACESACPVAAFEKLEQGPVVYHAERCMGCRYCMMACPFNVPTYQWDQVIPYVRKCTFCAQRILENPAQPALPSERVPACAQACPTGTLQFGRREALLREARQRIQDNPGRYVELIYGEQQAGGTSWLYLSPLPFAMLGFPMGVREQAYPEYTEVALGSVPPLLVGGGLVLAGLYTLWKRKQALAQDAETPPAPARQGKVES